MRIRSRFAVRCAKITSFLIKKMNRGSGVTLPGYVARRIDPHIFKGNIRSGAGEDSCHNGDERKDNNKCDPVQGTGVRKKEGYY